MDGRVVAWEVGWLHEWFGVRYRGLHGWWGGCMGGGVVAWVVGWLYGWWGG